MALRDLIGFELDTLLIEPLYVNLNPELKFTESGLAIQKRIDAAKNTALGKLAPNISQKDPDGNVVSLSDFKGKYVLLEFWASWCRPCREENPNLVSAYKNYNEKGFTILGVSLDDERSKQAWVNAILDDGLQWTQISDLNGVRNKAAILYGVTGIPQNFLIDSEGKIIAKNLRGSMLNETLQDIFSN